jgi:hypothetical protein
MLTSFDRYLYAADANTREEWKAHLFAIVDTRTGERFHVCKNHKQPESWDPDSHFVSGTPKDSAYDVQNVRRQNEYYNNNDEFRRKQQLRASIGQRELDIVVGAKEKAKDPSITTTLAMQSARVKERVMRKREMVYAPGGPGPIRQWSGKPNPDDTPIPDYEIYGPLTGHIMSPIMLDGSTCRVSWQEADAIVSTGNGYPTLSTAWVYWKEGVAPYKYINDHKMEAEKWHSVVGRYLYKTMIPKAVQKWWPGRFSWKPDWMLDTVGSGEHDINGGQWFTRKAFTETIRFITIDGKQGDKCTDTKIKVIGRARGVVQKGIEIQMLQVRDMHHFWKWLDAADWDAQDMVERKTHGTVDVTLDQETVKTLTLKLKWVNLSKAGRQQILMEEVTDTKHVLPEGTVVKAIHQNGVTVFRQRLKLVRLETIYPTTRDNEGAPIGKKTRGPLWNRKDTMDQEIEAHITSLDNSIGTETAIKESVERVASDSGTGSDHTFHKEEVHVHDEKSYSIGADVRPYVDNFGKKTKLAEVIASSVSAWNPLEIIHHTYDPNPYAKKYINSDVTAWINSLTTQDTQPMVIVEPVDFNYEHIGKGAYRFISGSNALLLALNGSDTRSTEKTSLSLGGLGKQIGTNPNVGDKITIITGVDQCPAGDMEAIRTLNSIRRRAHLNQWPQAILRRSQTGGDLTMINITKMADSDLPEILIRRLEYADHTLRSHLAKVQRVHQSGRIKRFDHVAMGAEKSIQIQPVWTPPHIECFMKPGEGRWVNSNNNMKISVYTGWDRDSGKHERKKFYKEEFFTAPAEMKAGTGSAQILFTFRNKKIMRVIGFAKSWKTKVPQNDPRLKKKVSYFGVEGGEGSPYFTTDQTQTFETILGTNQKWMQTTSPIVSVHTIGSTFSNVTHDKGMNISLNNSLIDTASVISWLNDWGASGHGQDIDLQRDWKSGVIGADTVMYYVETDFVYDVVKDNIRKSVAPLLNASDGTNRLARDPVAQMVKSMQLPVDAPTTSKKWTGDVSLMDAQPNLTANKAKGKGFQLGWV